MPEMDGIALQRELVARRSPLQVIVMTGHGDIPIAVGAMKAGAVDFLGKGRSTNRCCSTACAGRSIAPGRPATKPRKRMVRRTQSGDVDGAGNGKCSTSSSAGKANKVIATNCRFPKDSGNPTAPRHGKDGRR